MLKVLSEATSKFVQDNANDVDNTTETIGTMAKVCLRMLEKEWVGKLSFQNFLKSGDFTVLWMLWGFKSFENNLKILLKLKKIIH